MERRIALDRKKQLQFLLICLGVLLSIQLFSGTDFHSLSVVVNLNVKVGHPAYTSVVIPPVGEIRARTHLVPLRLNLELKNVNLALLRGIVFSTPESMDAIYSELANGFKRLIYYFIAKLLLLGTSGAVVSLYLLGARDGKSLLVGGLIGFLFVSVLTGLMYFSYDLQAFEQLEYEGIIEAAPWALDLAWQTLSQVEELGNRIQTLARNLYSVLERLEQLGPLSLVQGDLVAVHVSDIHNNPVAYDFLKQIVESFPVQVIFDTGDLTDWGTTLEAEVTARIAELKIPYVFVSGNHESLEVLERLAELDNVIVVEHSVTKILDLVIVGVSDLAATNLLPAPASIDDLAKQAENINNYWSEIEERPDILMVHNHRVAKAIKPGLFPLVLYGHTHVLELEQIDGTIYNNAGTTGAAGIRGFQTREPLPYSLSLLYFSRNEQDKLAVQAIDGVHVTGLGSSFSLQRTFIEASRNPDLNVEKLR